VVAARVRELLELVRLPDIAARRPGELSGGQRQRVALARALAVEPELLLLDEPLSALDARLRDELREELRRLLRRLGATALYVTHDHTDALELGDRVAVVRAGRIEQIDVPESVYERPGSRFVARFCGDAVLLDAVPAGSGAATLPDGTRLRVAGGDPAGTAVAVRPEALTVGTGPDGPEQGLPGRVVERRYAQGRTRLLVRTAGGDLPVLTDLGGPPEGAEVVVGVPAQRCWLVGDG
jgi:ABC-type Fe3+/spermidine/putrescine transport system ATPase subunit